MTEQQRAEAIEHRRLCRQPLHAPPHFDEPGQHCYHLTAANYEHASIIGKDAERMTRFCSTLCAAVDEAAAKLHAWCVLPNHYHMLLEATSLKDVLARIGKLHGRTSFIWNQEDGLRGRQCWHRCADRRIRSEGHFHAVRNYVHHNPVKHGYVARWEDWPWSSAADYVRDVGQETARALWEKYPVLDMGKGWDDERGPSVVMVPSGNGRPAKAGTTNGVFVIPPSGGPPPAKAGTTNDFSSHGPFVVPPLGGLPPARAGTTSRPFVVPPLGGLSPHGHASMPTVWARQETRHNGFIHERSVEELNL